LPFRRGSWKAYAPLTSPERGIECRKQRSTLYGRIARRPLGVATCEAGRPVGSAEQSEAERLRIIRTLRHPASECFSGIRHLNPLTPAILLW
jgi:hypothetical protein